jgi:hypothetical protein
VRSSVALRSAPLGIALLTGAACTPPDVPNPTGQIAQACDDYATAGCKLLNLCSPSETVVRYGSEVACRTLLAAQCNISSSAPSSGQTTTFLEGCVQTLNESIADVGSPTSPWACSDFVLSQNPPVSCALPSGALANGAACAVAQQCQSAFCATPPGAACGTCAAAPQIGDACPTNQCARGLRCGGSSPVCSAYAQMGMPCGNGVNCGVALSCVNLVCQPAVKSLGAPCDGVSGAGCDFYSGLACSDETNTCQTARLSPPGGPCGMVEYQPASCSLSTCLDGACVGDALLGEPCDLGGPSCQAETTCVTFDGGTTGTCRYHGATACP